MGINKFKFVFLGSCNTGKSCIVYRYINKTFLEVFQSTIGGAFLNKTIYKDEMTYTLDIWDTAGQERYLSLLPMYYRNSDIVFLCFDLTENIEKVSKKINFWLKQLNQFNDKPTREIIFVGTKSDLVNDITIDKFSDLIEKKYSGKIFIETSSKNNINIEKIFEIGLDRAIKNQSQVIVSTINKETLIMQNVIKKDSWWASCSIL